MSLSLSPTFSPEHVNYLSELEVIGEDEVMAYATVTGCDTIRVLAERPCGYRVSILTVVPKATNDAD